MLSLEGGWELEEIEKWPARKVERYRRLFDRCPFGPVRGDLQAWLVARNVAEVFAGRFRPAAEATLGFRKKRERRPQPVQTKVTGRKMRELTKALGGTIKDKSDGGTA